MRGFISQGDWENEPLIPIDAAGIMILDAAVVGTQLKAQPWQQANQFLGGTEPPVVFFGRYLGKGNGLEALKAKYASNQSTIDAKFYALKT